MRDIQKKELRKEISQEVSYLLSHRNHPPVHSDIDVVWVFSGPGTFFTPLDAGEEPWMAWMDRYRILYGIALVKKITAVRISKAVSAVMPSDIQQYGPIFFYNGTPSENDAIREAIHGNKILPQSNVIIVDSVVDKGYPRAIENTLDQIKSFPKELPTKSPIRTVAIVSHSTHLVRILRYLQKFTIFPDTVHVEVFALKPNKGEIETGIPEEIDKIWNYFQKGDLSWEPFPAEQ